MQTIENTLLSIGIIIEMLRKERKMTKVALADFSGLQECHIRKIIAGKQNLTIKTLLAICDTLGISLTELFQKVDQLEKKHLG